MMERGLLGSTLSSQIRVLSQLLFKTKHHELGGLKLKFTISVLETQSLKSGCWRGHAPSGETPCFSPASDGLLASFGVLGLQLHDSNLCLHLHMASTCVSLSSHGRLIRTAVILDQGAGHLLK